jgi:uncharacterized Tic20 family protein
MAGYRSRQRHPAQPGSLPAPREAPDPAALAPPVPAPPALAPPALGRPARLAVLCYAGLFLGFLVPLACYLASRRAPEVRWHAVQALNLWITVVLYTLCALIIGAVLALDAAGVALIIVAPLAAALWLFALRFGIRAAVAAGRGGRYRIPSWLCATILR